MDLKKLRLLASASNGQSLVADAYTCFDFMLKAFKRFCTPQYKPERPCIFQYVTLARATYGLIYAFKWIHIFTLRPF